MAPGDGVRAIFQDQKSIEENAVLLYNAGNGVIVQLGERLHGMQEVVSSSLISSIFLFPKFKSADSQQIFNSFPVLCYNSLTLYGLFIMHPHNHAVFKFMINSERIKSVS